jgi:hypothetical protein
MLGGGGGEGEAGRTCTDGGNVIRRHQSPSVVIRRHQASSGVNQASSGVIRRHRTCTDHGNVERLGGGLVGEQLRLVPDDGRNPCQSVALDENQQRTQRQSVALSGNQWHSL